MLRKILIILGLYGTCFYLIFALVISWIAKSETLYCQSVDGWSISGGSLLYGLYDLVFLSGICVLLFTTAKVLFDSVMGEILCLAILLALSILNMMILLFSEPYPIVSCSINGLTEEIDSVSRFLAYRLVYLVGVFVILCTQIWVIYKAWTEKQRRNQDLPGNDG